MDLSKILFIDIETVSQYAKLEDAPQSYQDLWEHKAGFLMKDETDSPSSVYERAGIYAEFGQIVCISAGFIHQSGSDNELRIKSFSGKDERVLLEEFAQMLNQHYNSNDSLLCAHNGKEFDFPYIARRMIVQGVKIPNVLNLMGKKPWEVGHLDTMQMWKFGDFKSFTSLKLLAHSFGIPSPKDDIDGSQVGQVFWVEDDLDRIVRYCEKDVLTLAKVYLKLVQSEVELE
ncbi:MAG: 3'-5' exonuclease [Salibacteraceae bacterium]